MPYLGVELKEVGELNDTERGVGGFGSTEVSTEIYGQMCFDMNGNIMDGVETSI